MIFPEIQTSLVDILELLKSLLIVPTRIFAMRIVGFGKFFKMFGGSGMESDSAILVENLVRRVGQDSWSSYQLKNVLVWFLRQSQNEDFFCWEQDPVGPECKVRFQELWGKYCSRTTHLI